MAGRSDRIEAVAYDYDGREKEPVERCNLCGSEDTVEASTVGRYGFAQPLRLCRRCGLAFLSPRLTEREYADFYRDVYRPLVSAYHGRLIDAETVQVEQREYADELVAFLRENLSGSPETILDVGGSTGVVSGDRGRSALARRFSTRRPTAPRWQPNAGSRRSPASRRPMTPRRT